jgi:hypothetical protein
MEHGSLQAGRETVSVLYEMTTTLNRGKRETKGTLRLTQTPRAELSWALSNLTGANLVTADGKKRWIEFTRNDNGSCVEFNALTAH